jgi:hypothetical protein
MSSCIDPNDALPKWILAKRKMIVEKYGNTGGTASAHAAMPSDVPADDADILPTLEDFTDEFDNTEVSVPFSFVAFSSSLALGRDLSKFWVVDSACSINFPRFKVLSLRSPRPPLPIACVGSVLTLSAVAKCGFPFS